MVTPSNRPVTGAMLRDIVVCERRAWLDVHGDPSVRDAVSSFVQLLWSGGVAHEREIHDAMAGRIADLREVAPSERRRATLVALEADVDHILGAEISHGDLLGRPDLISRLDRGWCAGDIKAGTPYMADGRRVKAEYGVQIGLYARLLGAISAGSADRAFIVGSDGLTASYDLQAAWGTTTVAAMVDEGIELARSIHHGTASTRGAAAAQCGLCHWRSLCRRELEAADDVTLIAELGRKLRAGVETVAGTRTELSHLDMAGVALPGGRTVVPGLGLARLKRFRDRARLQCTPGTGPYARAPLGLSRSATEWHLDIEADPTRLGGYVYLHGIWERVLEDDGTSRDRFIEFFADGADGEREAFAGVWSFLNSEPEARVYYYSPFERTSYRVLQRRYPDVCSAEEIEAFFASPRTLDLYTDVVRPLTEWPLSSYGIKPIAKSLGFSWSADDAGGANSIAWYVEWLSTGDPKLRAKIIDYNRSDCIASAVVLDALISLPVRAPNENELLQPDL